MINSLSADLNLSYLDDPTLRGPEEVIAQDVQRIIDAGDSIGLHLNISKCERISSPDFQVSDVTLKSFSRTFIADASLPVLHCSLVWFSMRLGLLDAQNSTEQ